MSETGSVWKDKEIERLKGLVSHCGENHDWQAWNEQLNKRQDRIEELEKENAHLKERLAFPCVSEKCEKKVERMQRVCEAAKIYVYKDPGETCKFDYELLESSVKALDTEDAG